MLRLQPHHDHNFRGVDCMIDFRLVVRSVLVLQCVGRKEYAISVSLKSVAELARQLAVSRLFRGIL